MDNDDIEKAPLGKKPVEKLFKADQKNYVQHFSDTFIFLDESKAGNLKFDLHPKGMIHSGYLSRADSPPDLV